MKQLKEEITPVIGISCYNSWKIHLKENEKNDFEMYKYFEDRMVSS